MSDLTRRHIVRTIAEFERDIAAAAAQPSTPHRVRYIAERQQRVTALRARLTVAAAA